MHHITINRIISKPIPGNVSENQIRSMQNNDLKELKECMSKMTDKIEKYLECSDVKENFRSRLFTLLRNADQWSVLLNQKYEGLKMHEIESGD